MINLRASNSGSRRFAIVGGLATVVLCVARGPGTHAGHHEVSPETHSVLLENAQVRVLTW